MTEKDTPETRKGGQLEKNLRVKPDVYMATLLDEVNEHLVELIDKIDNADKKSVQPTKFYTTPETAITVATPKAPDSPDDISDPTTVPPTTGYQAHTIYETLQRISRSISVISDGDSTIFVISSSDGKTWTPENPILPGESRTFFNVYELRIRSPVAGDTIAFSGGVYRITEYEFRLAYSGLQPATASALGSTPLGTANLTFFMVNFLGRPMNATFDTLTALGAGATFYGATRDFQNSRLGFMGAVAVSDVASAASGFRIQQSNETIVWLDFDGVLMPGLAGARVKSAIAKRYARVAYTNGAVAQTVFSLGSRAMIS